MNKFYNPKLTKNSRILRKNMTEEERKLWYLCLKNLPYTVHRQKVIKDYIVDFCIMGKKIIIELDGSQHYEEDKERSDRERDRILKELGYTVLRYSNLEVNRNFDGVCADIYNHVIRE